MDQSLYMTLDKCDQTDKLIQDIKSNLNERLIIEMKYIIKEYNKKKRNKKDVGVFEKKSRDYKPPSLVIDFN